MSGRNQEELERRLFLMLTLLLAEVWPTMSDLEALSGMGNLDAQVLGACRARSIDPDDRRVRRARNYAQFSVARLVSLRIVMNLGLLSLTQAYDTDIIAGDSLDTSLIDEQLDEYTVRILVGRFVVFYRDLLAALLSSIHPDSVVAFDRFEQAFMEVTLGTVESSAAIADGQLRTRILAALSLSLQQWHDFGAQVAALLVRDIPAALRADATAVVIAQFDRRWGQLPMV